MFSYSSNFNASRAQPSKRFEHVPSADGLPLAIGANFHDDPICRTTCRKSHTLSLKPQPTTVNYAPHTEYVYNGGVSSGSAGGSLGGGANPSASTSPRLLATTKAAAADAALEKETRFQVLKFLAYLREIIPESAQERVRIRRVSIEFYPSDWSCAIREPVTPNGGMDGGLLLSRRQVPRNPASNSANKEDLIGLDDLQIGNTVTIYGHTYAIVDMDDRTREYFTVELGRDDIPLEAVPWPDEEDTYTQKLNTQKQRQLASVRRHLKTEEMDEKRVMEQLLTGIITKHPNDEILATQQFLRNRVNEHLSFLALWDDRKARCGDLRLCVIRVYLENSAVEIIEQRKENSGRVGGATLLQRCRVPRTDADLSDPRVQQHTFGLFVKKDFLEPVDFSIGTTLHIYGRDYYVYDADMFTRKYMSTELGVELGPSEDVSALSGAKEGTADVQTMTASRKRTEDGSGLRDPAVMHFEAKLATPFVSGDEEREFVIAFFSGTGEVEVQEKQQRNTGFIGGRFLAKGRHQRRLPSGKFVPFTPSDFTVGETVTIYERPFTVVGTDEATKRAIAGTAHPVNEQRVRELVLLFKQLVHSRFPRAHDAFYSLAPTGVITVRDIETFMRARSCSVTKEEAMYVLQNAAPKGDGVIHFDDFVSLLYSSEQSMDEASLSARSVKNVTMAQDTRYETNATSAESSLRRRQLHQMLLEKLVLRRGSTHDQFLFLSGHSKNSKLSRSAFRRALNESLHFNMPPSDEDMLVSLLFDGKEDAQEEITYKQFQEFVESPRMETGRVAA